MPSSIGPALSGAAGGVEKWTAEQRMQFIRFVIDVVLGWSDTPRIKYIMFLPDTPLLLLATVVRGVNTLLG